MSPNMYESETCHQTCWWSAQNQLTEGSRRTNVLEATEAGMQAVLLSALRSCRMRPTAEELACSRRRCWWWWWRMMMKTMMMMMVVITFWSRCNNSQNECLRNKNSCNESLVSEAYLHTIPTCISFLRKWNIVILIIRGKSSNTHTRHVEEFRDEQSHLRGFYFGRVGCLR